MDDGMYYRQYLAGDDDGLRLLIDEYRYGLTIYLNTMLEDYGAAEDIAQDVFIELALHRPEYSGHSSFKTWLYAIAKHKAQHFSRSRREYPDEAALAEGVSPEEVESYVIRSDNDRMLYAAMKRLKSSYRQVLYLIYFEQMSISDAARIMGRSGRYVSHLHFRAKKSLKQELIKEGFVYED